MRRNIMQNIHECEKCGRIYETENLEQKNCDSCNDPAIAKKQIEKLKKSKYLKLQSWGR